MRKRRHRERGAGALEPGRGVEAAEPVVEHEGLVPAQRLRAPAAGRRAAQRERPLHLLAGEARVVERAGRDLAQPAGDLELGAVELGAVHALVHQQQAFEAAAAAQRRSPLRNNLAPPFASNNYPWNSASAS